MTRPRFLEQFLNTDLRETVIDWMGEWVGDYDIDASTENMRAKIDAATDDIDWSRWEDEDDNLATYNDRVADCWQSDDWLVERGPE